MENRIAIIGIIVENNEAAKDVNEVLHTYNEAIIGRMGLPYKSRKIGVISIIVDADNNTINTLSGKLGMIRGINVKTMYAKVNGDNE
ncbi:TM1266 family iron-only hydrogenase system putative regulator [Anaerotignum sp. MB30-C6]|uniref:TM1266 family iron-only hydrogenase system putative regulator n=1 Tax=Anaerotignum sp. MB30-C6 TaxID=3070814 RepID=UPI0027DE3B24|nr:TM1266 family iron-only hydrogenase system putative regulator [Anaerotignum sp. MB30-C6]WMI80001.1 iron-only hydrogenase system regulator [Anaerotignum sp. MB30-C6]